MTLDIHIEKADTETTMETYIAMARIHQSEIDGGFLSTFPLLFLAKMYRALAGSPYSFLYVAKNSAGSVCGFICGGIDTRKVMNRFLFRNAVFVLPYLLPRLFSIKNIRKIIETLLYPSKETNDTLPSQEILNFCVDSSQQRHGVGKKLFFSLVEEFRHRGIMKFKIVTGESQVKAQRFYEGLGVQKTHQFEVHRGIQSFVYTYDIELLENDKEK